MSLHNPTTSLFRLCAVAAHQAPNHRVSCMADFGFVVGCHCLLGRRRCCNIRRVCLCVCACMHNVVTVVVANNLSILGLPIRDAFEIKMEVTFAVNSLERIIQDQHYAVGPCVQSRVRIVRVNGRNAVPNNFLIKIPLCSVCQLH